MLGNMQALHETMNDSRRRALGQFGMLGNLYDARTDSILPNSFLRSTAPLEEVVKCQKQPTLKYKYSTTDSLEEKLSNLDISANLGISLLCGIVQCSLGGDYILKKKPKDHVREASAICSMQTEVERLVLEDVDAIHLNFDALKTAGATHVIYGIDWGAQTVVKVTDTVTSEEETQDIKGKARGSRGGQGADDWEKGSERESQSGCGKKPEDMKEKGPETIVQPSTDKKSDLMSQVVSKIGKFSVGGSVHIDDKLTKKASKFEFDIFADVSDHSVGSLPRDFEGVLNYIAAMPARLQGTSGNKGVPQTFYLRSIHDIASAFGQTIIQTHLTNRIDQSNLIDVVKRLEELESITQQFSNHEEFLLAHSFCVPEAQLKQARKRAKNAKAAESSFKTDLRETVCKIRGGEADNGSLAELLRDQESSSDEINKSSAFLQEYVNKAKFADEARGKGAIYVKNQDEEMHRAIVDPAYENVFVLYTSEDVQTHQDWPVTRQAVMDLLNIQGAQDCVIIVDCDVGKSKLLKLEKAFIEKYMGGVLRVQDVVEDMKDLAEKCLIRCNDSNRIDSSRSVAHSADRRPVKMLCPGANCFADKQNHHWSCPKCRELVFYEPTDGSLCCQCSRYPYSCAVFKCKSKGHGRSWTEIDSDHFLNTLSRLNPSLEYNLLLLGESGIGKSTFINALLNYLEFESLDSALNDPKPLRYQIPTYFDYGEVIDEAEVDEYRTGTGGLGMAKYVPYWKGSGKQSNTDHIIKVGMETESERFSTIGQSATSKSKVYSFPIGAAILRIIDTPGMCDTNGILQDQKNIQDILETLESVDKLSGIMVLLPIVQQRTAPAFKYYMTELLSNLHVDASENILFGYTRASSTRWRLHDVKVALANMLKELKTEIVPGKDNQFMFDSEPFRYLAACKQLGRQLPGKQQYDAMWAKSSEQILKLITKLEQLPVHEVGKTLCLKRTRDFLKGMAKPLTNIVSAMEESQKSQETIRQELSQLMISDADFTEKLNKLQIPIITSTRNDLPNPRIVCSHQDCDRTKACHDPCDVNAPDEVKGHDAVEGCYAFRKFLVLHYGACRKCGHDWKEHMRISYLMIREEKPLDSEKISLYSGEIKSIKGKEDAVASRMAEVMAAMYEICQEESQMKIARAKFEIYLSRSAIVTKSEEGSRHNDTTGSYLDDRISEARRRGNREAVRELEQQKKDYKDNFDALRNAIISETDIDEIIEGLKEMKHYGKSFDSAVRQETFALKKEQRVVSVKVGQGGKVSRFWKAVEDRLSYVGY